MANAPPHSGRMLILAGTLFVACLALLATRSGPDRAGKTSGAAASPAWIALNRDGLAGFERGDYRSALASFERALALRPDDEVLRKNVAQAHAALGWDALRNDDFPEAQTHFDRAIAF